MRAVFFEYNFCQLTGDIDKSCKMFKKKRDFERFILLEFTVFQFHCSLAMKIHRFACETNRARRTCWARDSTLASDRARLMERPSVFICLEFAKNKRFVS